MALSDYRRKRDFAATPEPAGGDKEAQPPRQRFTIHKHAARRLHYDLRLEIEGVLKCWAVPKGPCLDRQEKRLAVETEDHPVEYLDFEGVIPAGSYGAGTMIAWDRGTWSSDEDATAALAEGMLKFQLDGEKLSGKWMLVKIKPREGEPDRNWLLVKENDEFAQSLSKGDILKEFPHSVLSGNTIEELAALERENKAPDDEAEPSTATDREWELPREAVEAALPRTIIPELATATAEPPDGDRWLHEIKFDGYRLIAFKRKGNVRLQTRKGQNWTERFPDLADAIAKLPAETAVLDGEVVALLENGVSSFSLLQTMLREGRAHRLVYFAFDLLYLDGHDLRRAPLTARKGLLRDLIGGDGPERLQYTDHIVGNGPAFFAECRRLGLEGVVSKRADSAYRERRTPEWLKAKCVHRDEFVIGGFTDPEGTREGLGALIVGFHRGRDLVFAGKVGTGFDTRTLVSLRSQLDELAQQRNPFTQMSAERVEKGMHWVKPVLVAQIQYANWTGDKLLWHPVFQGLREDLPADGVTEPATIARTGADAGGTRTPIEASQLEGLGGIRLTHPDRRLYDDPPLSKLDLVKFYTSIADWILPQLAGRPLSLVRCPRGQGHSSFFQKHPVLGMPPTIKRVDVDEGPDAKPHLMIDDLAGLVSLVQFSVLEIHIWNARADQPERPDRLVFDLDPGPGVNFAQVVETALRVRRLLGDVGLKGFVKTTGGSGLHLVYPLQRRHSWDEVKEFGKAVATKLVGDSPRQLTISPAKAARKGKIYLDCNRNSRGATIVAPYSTRNRVGAPVSVPVSWDELAVITSSAQFTVENLVDRLGRLPADPWEGIDQLRQTLTAKRRRALGLA